MRTRLLQRKVCQNLFPPFEQQLLVLCPHCVVFFPALPVDSQSPLDPTVRALHISCMFRLIKFPVGVRFNLTRRLCYRVLASPGVRVWFCSKVLNILWAPRLPYQTNEKSGNGCWTKGKNMYCLVSHHCFDAVVVFMVTSFHPDRISANVCGTYFGD